MTTGTVGTLGVGTRVVFRFISRAASSHGVIYTAYALALQSAPIENACKIWAMLTAGARWAPSIWRRPAPRIFRWWTARAAWRQLRKPCCRRSARTTLQPKRGTVMQPTGDGPSNKKNAQASPSNAPSIPGASSRDDGSKHRTRRPLWGGRVLLRRSPPSDRRTWKIPKLRRVVSPAFRGGYLNVVTASLGELSGLFKS